MVEKTPENYKDIAELAAEMQNKYNKGENITDEELKKLADIAGISVEEALKAFEEGRKEALLAEAEPEEPEMTEEESEAYFKERNKYYTKLAQDPNLTKEQAQEIADFYSLTLEEVWDENREHKTKSNIKDTASTVVKEEVERSICRRVIRFIRRLFRG